MSDPAPTPNIHLQPINANRRTWAEIMNDNLILIDAVIGTYFVVQNLQGAWQNSTTYAVGDSVVDETTAAVFQCQVPHVSAALPTTFLEDRIANPSYWTVYSSPARARGAWLPNTNYALNDFVVNGSQYAVATETHTSSSSFANDLAAGKWSVLVDLSLVGSQVLPVPGGATDARKIVAVTSSGSGYTIYSQADSLSLLLGATSIGTAVLQAANQSAALAAIGAQASGSYQTANANLTTLAAVTPGVYGLVLLSMPAVGSLQLSLGLGTAAYMTGPVGTIVGTTDAQALTNKSTTTPAQDDNSTKLATTAYVDRVAVQQIVRTEVTALVSHSGVTPFDNTKPQFSEGSQYGLAVTITPKSATSRLKVRSRINFGTAAGGLTGVTAHIHRDSAADALKAVGVIMGTGPTQLEVECEVVSGAAVATTFELILGDSTAEAIYLNGSAAAQLYGGVSESFIEVMEYGP